MTAPSAVFGSRALASPLSSPGDIYLLSQHELRNHNESSVSLNIDSISSVRDDGEERKESETENVGKENKKNARRINTDMLVYKIFYFMFYGAVGSLFPYLAVFYKQLYLSAQQVGFLIGIRPFIQMSTGPLWGALADTYNVKKVILLISILAWLATNYSISIVRVPPETACVGNISLIKMPEVGRLRENKKTNPYSRKLKNELFKYNFPKPYKYIRKIGNNFTWYPLFRRKMRKKTRPRRRVQNSSFHLLLYAKLRANDPIKILNAIGETSSLESSEEVFKVYFKGERFRREFERGNEEELWSKLNESEFEKLPIERLLAADELEEEFDSLNTDEGYPWPLDSIESVKQDEAKEASKNSLNIFIVLIVITIIGTVLASPAATLADTATLENLGDCTYQYGYQRLWGAFGWGLCAFIVGIIVSSIQKSECEKGRHVDYILSFYVYAAMMALAFICAVFFRFNPVENQSAYTASLWEAIRMFTDCQHGCFVVTLLTSGAAMGFIHTFLFWHLHDIGGTQFLFSIISAVQCVSEVLTYLVSGYLMFHIGCDNVFYIGLLSNVCRLLAYSVIKNPLFSIPLEILQGISSASIWTAAICYVGLFPGTPVTLQALLHGIYWGLGHGGGGILGGVMVTYIGSSTTFIVYSVICLVNFLILISLKYGSKLMEYLGNYTYVENIPAGTYILTSMSQRGQTESSSPASREDVK